MTSLTAISTPASAKVIFSHVLVGVDGSPESLEAARQAAALVAPGGQVTALGAWQLPTTVAVPLGALPSYGPAEERAAQRLAEDAVLAARRHFPNAPAKLVRGIAGDALLEEIRREHVTLVAVGSHGQGRAAGVLVGSTATRLLHAAPCSVLVVRPSGAPTPSSIAVGVDGSPESARAFAAARYLSQRFGAELTVVVAEGDRSVDLAGVSLVVGDEFRVTQGEPVHALTAASAQVDLLVVGSRALRGVRSFGSVSERVGHKAECSVLVVRGGDAA